MAADLALRSRLFQGRLGVRWRGPQPQHAPNRHGSAAHLGSQSNSGQLGGVFRFSMSLLQTVHRNVAATHPRGTCTSSPHFWTVPLSIYSWARPAAEISTCVALQDKPAFWKLHDFLFAQQQDVSPETLQQKALQFIAHETAVDSQSVTACLAQKAFADPLHRDEQWARDLGISSTPTLFLNGRRFSVRSPRRPASRFACIATEGRSRATSSEAKVQQQAGRLRAVDRYSVRGERVAGCRQMVTAGPG